MTFMLGLACTLLSGWESVIAILKDLSKGCFGPKMTSEAISENLILEFFLEVHAYAHAIIQFPQSDVSSYITAISKKFSTSYKV